MSTRDVQTGSADGTYAVRHPRPTDAIGQTLRGAFGATAALPDDMLDALASLDRGARRH